MMNTSEKQKEVSFTLVAINIILIICVTGFAASIYQAKKDHPTSPVAVAQPNLDAFAHLSLQAQAAVVWDPTTGKILYAKSANATRPLASLTKVMTAVTALTLLPKNATVSIPPEALLIEGDSGLYSNEHWTLEKLLNFSLTVSSNDGAASVAAAAGAFGLPANSPVMSYADEVSTFVSKMNSTAQDLGLTTFHFTNPTGLDGVDGQNGGQGSALDMAKLFSLAFRKYPEIFAGTKNPTDVISSLDDTHTALNTDLAVTHIPGILAGKTGYTDLAGGNLAVVMDAGLGRPITIVVLGSSTNGRFSDVEALASSTLAAIQQDSSI